MQTIKRFVTIADCGTLHGAAKKLSLTQPALTRCIRLLEQDCKAQLFERHARGLTLTPFGMRACQHARNLLRECQLAEDDLKTLLDGGMGSIRLAGAPVWMTSILPEVIPGLHQQFPDLQIKLKSMNFTAALEGLSNGELDIYCGGFQSTNSIPPFLSSLPVFRTRMNVVARRGHPILDKPLRHLDPLLEHPWLSYMSDNSYLDSVMDKVFADTGRRCQAAIQCDSMLTALTLLNNGNYLSFLPSTFITSLPWFDLQIINTSIAEAGFNSGMIYRRSLENSSLLVTFNKLVHECVEESPISVD